MNALLQLVIAYPLAFRTQDLPCALHGHHEAALLALLGTQAA